MTSLLPTFYVDPLTREVRAERRCVGSRIHRRKDRKVLAFHRGVILFLAVMVFALEYGLKRQADRMDEDRSVEIAAAVAGRVAEALAQQRKPDPGLCIQYQVHMEAWTITHCRNKSVGI